MEADDGGRASAFDTPGQEPQLVICRATTVAVKRESRNRRAGLGAVWRGVVDSLLGFWRCDIRLSCVEAASLHPGRLNYGAVTFVFRFAKVGV